MKLNLARSLCLALYLAASAVVADSVTLYPDRDATLIEHPHGELANGAGPSLFVGRTAQAGNSIRRALLHFDVAGALPGNAIIKDVSLTLHLSPSNPAPADVAAHRVLDDWEEGPSSSSGGGGAMARAGDVTWLHTRYDTGYWRRTGGHFVARQSAWTKVEASGFYTWQNSHILLADVRLWQHAPQRNFGWLLVGNEDASQSVKRFASRESPTSEFRPALTIHYRLPGKTRSDKIHSFQ